MKKESYLNFVRKLTLWTLLILSSMISQAASRYWVASSTSNWNNSANWSTTSGGTGGASIPGSSDDVYFTSARNGNCNIDAIVNINGISISGYTGTITNTTYAFTVSANNYFTQTSGTFNAGSSNLTIESRLTISGGTFNGGNSTIDINGTGFYLTGGTFTSTSGNLYLSNRWDHNTSGTFNHNNGTIIFDGTSNSVIYMLSNTENFYNININKTGAGVVYLYSSGDKAVCNGSLNFTQGSVSSWNSLPVAFETKNDATVYSTFGTVSTYVSVNFTGTGTQNFNLSSATDKLDGPIGINKSSGQVDMNSNLTLNSGAQLNLISGTLNLNGYTISNTNGTTVCTGLVTITGTGTLDNYGYSQTSAGAGLTISGVSTFAIGGGYFTQSAGTFNGGVATLDFNGHFQLSGGTFTSTSQTLYLSYAWTHSTSGTFNHNNGTVEFDGTVSSTTNGKIQIVNNTETFYNLRFNLTSGTRYVYSNNDNLVVLNNLTLSGGTIAPWNDGYSINLDVRGNATVTSSFSSLHKDITLLFSGSTAIQNLDLTGATALVDGHFKVNKTEGEVKLLSDIVMNGSTAHNFTMSSGTLNLNGKTVTNTSGGYFYVNSSTSYISGTGYFNHSNFSQTAGTINFTGASNVTIYNNFAITGGTFNSNNLTLDIDGSFSLATGTFNAPSGNMYVGKAWDHPSSGTFNHNFGTVIFDGNYSSSWFIFDFVSYEIFYNVTYNHPDCSGYNKLQSDGDYMIVGNNLNLSSGWIWSRSWETTGGSTRNMIKVGGNVTISPTYCNSSYPPTIVFLCDNNQDLDLSGSTNNYDGNFVINKGSGSVRLISNLTLDRTGGQSFIVGNGTLNLNGYTLSLGASSTISRYTGGTITYNGGSISGGSVTVTGTSYPTDGATCSALPVKLIFVRANRLNDNAVISWATASEINNDYFEIEKSTDNVHFDKIGIVKGNGTSQKLNNYTFVDNQFNNVTSYYRLKQVDYNGAFEYSPTVVLNNFADESISNFNIFPNPAINQVSIEDLRLRNNSVKISVTDIHGKISYSETFNDFTNIDLSHLTKGMYFISFLNENNQLIGNQKLLINK